MSESQGEGELVSHVFLGALDVAVQPRHLAYLVGRLRHHHVVLARRKVAFDDRRRVLGERVGLEHLQRGLILWHVGDHHDGGHADGA